MTVSLEDLRRIGLDVPWHLMRRLLQAHAARWQHQVSADITSPQFGLLRVLDRCPGLEQGRVGQLMRLDKNTTADIARRLERKGLLASERDPADARRKLLQLTPSGQALLRDLEPRVQRMEEEMLSVLAGDGAQDFHRALHRLLEHNER
ncbi:DNA-binding MarR family transcriptional regulator [Deinobacterium chartae]|uniref:DNA-binding MarR family transcriptional regulator n=1 Tax=Deinobacterium chartae TaxID=521158 RepID=A0A841I0Z7_9DEIO|nr:MarR family transcriptional regulator [Deinobacterium chartae]MBB6098766.1 DNA-binding MarR family transcriptional regulator [Deinobacterium chartae]